MEKTNINKRIEEKNNEIKILLNIIKENLYNENDLKNHWGHVGSTQRLLDDLKYITDYFIFSLWRL